MFRSVQLADISLIAVAFGCLGIAGLIFNSPYQIRTVFWRQIAYIAVLILAIVSVVFTEIFVVERVGLTAETGMVAVPGGVFGVFLAIGAFLQLRTLKNESKQIHERTQDAEDPPTRLRGADNA